MLFIVNNIQLQKRKAYFPVQVLFENSDQCPFNFAALFYYTILQDNTCTLLRTKD